MRLLAALLKRWTLLPLWSPTGIKAPSSDQLPQSGRPMTQANTVQPEGRMLRWLPLGLSPKAIDAPDAGAPAGDDEEHDGIEEGQLTLVHGRQELFAHLQLPMELGIGDCHRPAGEKGGDRGEGA